MIIKEVKAKSILNKSWIADYCINPYIGCQHSCIYCYADFYTRKIYGIEEGWGNYVFVKINSPSLLEKEIKKKKKGSVYISPLTDAYQPIERKYKLTRKILEILARNKWKAIVQTKSSLVLRDLDILKNFESEVGITLISLNKDVVKRLEKFASSIDERIKVLKELKENKIKNFLFVGPILPFTQEKEIEELIDSTKDFVDEYYFDKLNLKPGLEEKVKFLFEGKGFLEAENYYKKLKEFLEKMIERKKIKAKTLY